MVTAGAGGSPSALGNALEAARKHLLLTANRDLDDRLRAKIGASDLVQDTFLEAQRSFGCFRGETEADFFGWLSGILNHRLANNVRRYRHTRSRSVERESQNMKETEGALHWLYDDAPTPGATVSAREEERRVRLALGQMDERLRAVLIERTWQGAPLPKSVRSTQLLGRCRAQALGARPYVKCVNNSGN